MLNRHQAGPPFPEETSAASSMTSVDFTAELLAGRREEMMGIVLDWIRNGNDKRPDTIQVRNAEDVSGAEKQQTGAHFTKQV